MRFLADMGVSARTTRALQDHGHDVVHLRDTGLSRLSDPAILKKAAQEGRIILTFDLDFGDLLAAGLQSGPSVVIFRLANQTPAFLNPRLLGCLAECQESLDAGAVIIVEEARYRIHRLPIQPA